MFDFQNFVNEPEQCQEFWRKHVIGTFLTLPAVVSHKSEKCPSFEVFGVLGSHDLLRPSVNHANNLCLAQGDPRLELGRQCFALG